MLTHRLQSPDSRLRVFRYMSVCMQICMCVLFHHVSECACVQSSAALLLKPLCKTVPVTLSVYSVEFLSQQKHLDRERNI